MNVQLNFTGVKKIKLIIIFTVALAYQSKAPPQDYFSERKRLMELYYDTYHFVESERIKLDCIRKQRMISDYKEFENLIIKP